MDSPPGPPSSESSATPASEPPSSPEASPEPEPRPTARERLTTARTRLAEFLRNTPATVKPWWEWTRTQLTLPRTLLVLLALGALVFLVAGLQLLWPLLVWVADLPKFGLVAWSAVGLALVLFAILRLRAVRRPATTEDDAPQQPLSLPALIALVILVVSAAVGLIITGAWWVMGAKIPSTPNEFTVGHLNAISIRAFAIVAGLGATALLVINYRRQITTEAENKRAEAAVERENLKLFNERFTNAYTELGSEHPAVRLGAVHALANLADDAPEGREDLVQTVINVLCAYIRMPYTPAPKEPREGDSQASRERYRELKQEFDSIREVRHTILRLIGNHLREDTRWRGKNYDFSGTVFDGGDFTDIRLTSGHMDFSGAHFIDGNVSFFCAHFTDGRVIFSESHFTGGRVNFFGAQFTRGYVSFTKSHFAGGEVDFTVARFVRGSVDFRGAEGEDPIGLLESITKGSPNVALLPERWTRPS